MRITTNIFLLLQCISFFVGAKAQPSKEQSAAYKIYEDLPLDEAGKKSAVHPGENLAEKIKDNIFIKTTCSKTTCFIGEPIMVTYELYSALSNESTVSRSPSYQGFTIRKIAFTQESNYKTINNKQFRVFTVDKCVLTPYETGSIRLEPMGISNVISYGDNHGERKSYTGEVNGQATTISVMPLPVTKLVGLFSGAVGKFSITVKPEKAVFTVKENNRVVIEITGFGNLSNFSFPAVKWPPEFDVFEASEQLNTDADGKDFYARKTFVATIIAKKAGKYTIDPLKTIIFNPAENKYEELMSEPVQLTVNKNMHANPQANSIVPPAVGGNRTTWVVVVLAMVLVATIVTMMVVGKRKRSKAIEKNAIAARPAVSVMPVGVDYEAMIKATAANAQESAFLHAFKEVVKTYLVDKTKSGTGDSEEMLAEKLSVAEPANAAAIRKLMAHCNGLLYSPGSVNDHTRLDMVNRFLLILNTA